MKAISVMFLKKDAPIFTFAWKQINCWYRFQVQYHFDFVCFRGVLLLNLICFYFYLALRTFAERFVAIL